MCNSALSCFKNKAYIHHVFTLRGLVINLAISAQESIHYPRSTISIDETFLQANASEFLENFEEMFARYYTHNGSLASSKFILVCYPFQKAIDNNFSIFCPNENCIKW